MTDMISNKEMATQTPLPKVNLSFSLLNKHNRPLPQRPKLTLDEKLYMNDQRLQSQVQALRKIDDKLNGKMVDNFSVEQIQANDGYEFAAAFGDSNQQSMGFDPSAYNRQFETNNYCYSISTLENLDAAQDELKNVEDAAAMGGTVEEGEGSHATVCELVPCCSSIILAQRTRIIVCFTEAEHLGPHIDLVGGF